MFRTNTNAVFAACFLSALQPVYLQDIDFATLGSVATAADVLVKQARNRVRVNRLKEGQAKVIFPVGGSVDTAPFHIFSRIVSSALLVPAVFGVPSVLRT